MSECLFPYAEFLHVKPGKGAAFVRTKMRNYITGNTVEKTFRAGSTVIKIANPVLFIVSSIGFVHFSCQLPPRLKAEANKKLFNQ